jgi:hypothetical protein
VWRTLLHERGKGMHPLTSASISPVLVALAAVYGALVFVVLMNSSEIEVTLGRLKLVFRLRR